MFVRQHDGRTVDGDFRVAHATTRLSESRATFHGAEYLLVEIDCTRGAFHGDVGRNDLLHGSFLAAPACCWQVVCTAINPCKAVRFSAQRLAFMYS